MRFRFGRYELDEEKRELWQADQLVPLEPKVYQLLSYLLANRDRVVSKSELLEHCWVDTFVSESALTRCLARLRKAVQSEPGNPIIKTLHRQGYRFVAEVTTPSAAPLDAPRGDEPIALDRGSPVAAEPNRQDHNPMSWAERRPLTVLCCELISTTTSLDLIDPEEFHEVLAAYHTVSMSAIERFEGHLAHVLGNMLMIYFGYPQALEDATRRAVYTGLELVRGIASLGHVQAGHETIDLAVRIGIHTGMAVVGDIGGQPTVGAIPNMAADLRALAAPQVIVLSASTYQLVQDHFTIQELDVESELGDEIPVPLYQVVTDQPEPSESDETVRGEGSTRFIGREAELGLLRERWTYLQEGMGQVVLIQGEAGIGKSRLVRVLREQVVGELIQAWECRCSPYYQNTAFYPLIDLMRRALPALSAVSPEERLSCLETWLGHSGLDLKEAVPLLAHLLSLTLPEGRYAPLNLTPQHRRERTLETLVSLFLIQAAGSPLLLVIEDLHWVDPSTLDLLHLLASRVTSVPILMVLTSRPEFEPPGELRTVMTSIVLNRLTRMQVEAMITQITAGKSFPATVIEQLIEKTDGVPLFVEELTRMVVESDQLVEHDRHYELKGTQAELSIPATLHDSLMMRLDRLGPAKGVAQWGAVLGREFNYEVLDAVMSVDGETLQTSLTRLEQAELVFQRGVVPQLSYRFKHALIQDAAYSSLLKRRRQAMHRQIAHVLLEQFPETVETQPELIAHHYTEAGRVSQAMAYWQQAGDRAIQSSAHVEAVTHFTKGLELLRTLSDVPTRSQQELALLMALGPELMVVKGYAASEVEHTYARARELCRQVGDPRQLLEVLRGQFIFYMNRGELKTARELAEQRLSLAQQQPDPGFLLAAHDSLGTNWYHLGEFASARLHLERGIDIYNRHQYHLQPPVGRGTDHKVSCLCHLAWSLWFLGDIDQALRRSQEALNWAQDLAHPYSLTQARYWTAQLQQFCQHSALARDHAEAAIALGAQHGFAQQQAQGTFLRGWALAKQGRGAEGLSEMRQGFAAWEGTEAEILRPYYLTLMAERWGDNGEVEAGLALLDEAIAVTEITGEKNYEAEIYRLQGELILSQEGSNIAKAEFILSQALDVARCQQAKSLELRVAMSLSRLWRQQGKRSEAHALLSQVYDQFTEGFDTADLLDAKASLEEKG